MVASSSSSDTLRLVTGSVPFSSYVHFTVPPSISHVESSAREIDGMSSTSSTMTVTISVSVAPDGSFAVIDTSYALSPSASAGFSKSGAAFRLNDTLLSSLLGSDRLNIPPSAPPSPNTNRSLSPSAALKSATGFVFSSTFRVTLSGAASSPSISRSCIPNFGAAFSAGGLCTARVGLAAT